MYYEKMTAPQSLNTLCRFLWYQYKVSLSTNKDVKKLTNNISIKKSEKIKSTMLQKAIAICKSMFFKWVHYFS